MTKESEVADKYPPAFKRQSVGGIAVKSDVVYASPLSQVNGRIVPIHGIRTLTLADKSVVYGCRDCNFVGPGPGKVRGHRRVDGCGGIAEQHAAPKPAKVEGGVGQVHAPTPDALAMTLHEIVDLAGQLDELHAAQEHLDAENQGLRDKLAEEKRLHREELAELRREHREELGRTRAGQRAAEKELAGIKARLGKLIGDDS